MNAPLDVKELREALGLSQAEMADLLGVKRGLLSMNECDRRALPAAAMIRLNQINQVLLSHPDAPETEALPEENPAPLAILLAKYRLQKIHLEKDRQARDQGKEKEALLRKLLRHIGELNTPGFLPEKDASWKDSVEAQLEANAPVSPDAFLQQMELAVLTLRITLVETELHRTGWEGSSTN